MRPRASRLGASLLLAVAVAMSAGGAVATAASPDPGAADNCRANWEPRDVWLQVPMPEGARGGGEFDDDPCTLFAAKPDGTVERSRDGGLSWAAVFKSPRPLGQVFTEGLAQDTVFAGTEGAGSSSPTGPVAALYVSHNAGAQWSAVSGLDGVVVGLTSAPTDPSVLYATVRSAGPLRSAASIYRSTDFGNTFAPLPGSAPLSATTVAVDPVDPGTVWANSTPAPAGVGGLWKSTNAGISWQQADTASVADLAISLLPGGGVELLAATDKGMRRSVDGTTFTTLGVGAMTGVRFELNHPHAFLVVTASGLRRTSDGGAHFHPLPGLPSRCGAQRLQRDRSEPSTFLVDCTDDSIWRYRSDGSDLSDLDNPRPNPGSLPVDAGAGAPMRLLRTLRLPIRPDYPTNSGTAQSSAAVAFDGRLLYIANGKADGLVTRMSPLDGSFRGDLVLPIAHPVAEIAYDSARHGLFVVDTHANLYFSFLKSRRTTFLGRAPGATGAGDTLSLGSFSFDSTLGRIFALEDQGGELIEADASGTRVSACKTPLVSAAPNPTDVVNPNPGNVIPGAAAVVATGDGSVYLQMEDDKTVIRVNRGCELLARYTHSEFSEAGQENDSMACDTTTFDQPAIWERDSDAAAVFAYAVPGGYCALATSLAVTVASSVAANGGTDVCATLRLTGSGERLPGQAVGLFVNRVPLGTPVTDRTGRACAVYKPASFPGLPAPRTHPGRAGLAPRGILASYVGTIAYRPASAHGATNVVPELLPAIVPVAPQPPPAALAVPFIAPPPAAPPIPPQPPQSQPLAQSHPGAQPGAVGQPGAAAEREEEAEVSAQTSDVHQFSASNFGAGNFGSSRPQPLSTTLPVEVLAFGLAGVGLELRRRRSRVREQGAV